MSEYAPEDVSQDVSDHLDDEVTGEQVDAGSADVVADVESAVRETVDPVRTGVDGVDAVLRSVEDLDDVPVDEHVAVFEQAHEQLRGALDAGA